MVHGLKATQYRGEMKKESIDLNNIMQLWKHFPYYIVLFHSSYWTPTCVVGDLNTIVSNFDSSWNVMIVPILGLEKKPV